MRATVLMGAVAFTVWVTPVEAQPSAAAGDGATANPISRLVGAVRDRMSTNTTPATPAAQPARTTQKRSRRVRRGKSVRARSGIRTRSGVRTRVSSRSRMRARPVPVEADVSDVPWPRSVAMLRSKVQRPSAAPSGVTILRTRVVRRPIVQTIIIADHLLALPAVEILGEPVRLDVPGLGEVEVPEDRYGALFQLLSSQEPDKQQQALHTLRELRDTANALRAWAARSRGTQPPGAPAPVLGR